MALGYMVDLGSSRTPPPQPSVPIQKLLKALPWRLQPPRLFAEPGAVTDVRFYGTKRLRSETIRPSQIEPVPREPGARPRPPFRSSSHARSARHSSCHRRAARVRRHHDSDSVPCSWFCHTPETHRLVLAQ